MYSRVVHTLWFKQKQGNQGWGLVNFNKIGNGTDMMMATQIRVREEYVK